MLVPPHVLITRPRSSPKIPLRRPRERVCLTAAISHRGTGHGQGPSMGSTELLWVLLIEDGPPPLRDSHEVGIFK